MSLSTYAVGQNDVETSEQSPYKKIAMVITNAGKDGENDTASSKESCMFFFKKQ